MGAEFMIHSFSEGEASYIAPDYLVVEVALYPPRAKAIEIGLSQFHLRVNGKKQPLPAQPPQMVAMSLSHPQWREAPRLEADAGMGNVGVGIGHPRPEDIPGMPPEPGTRRPPPPEVPKDNPGGIGPREPVRPEELVVRTALPEGEIHSPRSGFLYFAYKGKIGSIKSLELLYGDVVVKLR